jgi:hypothetical protein
VNHQRVQIPKICGEVRDEAKKKASLGKKKQTLEKRREPWKKGKRVGTIESQPRSRGMGKPCPPLPGVYRRNPSPLPADGTHFTNPGVLRSEI